MILQQVARLLAEILGEGEEGITEETAFTPEYGIQPIDAAALVIAVEKKFHLTVYDDEAACFATVGDVVRYIEASQGDK